MEAAIIFFIFIVIALAIAFYFFMAFSIYTLANSRGVRNPWLAFIPYAQNYVLGDIIGNVNVFSVNTEQNTFCCLAQ